VKGDYGAQDGKDSVGIMARQLSSNRYRNLFLLPLAHKVTPKLSAILELSWSRLVPARCR